MAVWIPAAAQDVADGSRDEGFGAEHFPQEGLAPFEELPLFPEKRPTKTPTCPRIPEAFRGVSWYEFRRGTEVVCFPLKLNKLQKLLLELLEVPQRLYT